MDKRILLPTDYSKNAWNAISYALELYKNVYCEFYLLNAYQVSAYTLDNMMVPEPGEPHYEMAKALSEEAMDNLVDQIKFHPENPKHRFHTICTFNSLPESVKDLIAKKDIDIIVMGTQGITESRSRIFGTNTVFLMEHIKTCPILAVPQGFSYTPPKEIVFPTNYRTDYKKTELASLLEIAKLHNSKIHVVHIAKKKGGKLNLQEETNKQLLEDILDGTDYESHFLSSVKLSKGINIFMESRGCDMIAFLNKKHLFFGSIFSHPLEKEIGYSPKIPILELNDH